MICKHCNNTHVNDMEQALCPMRPEEIPLMIEQFGPLGQGDYRVTDRIRFLVDRREYVGVILWIVAPGASGALIEPGDTLRYIVEPFDLRIPFGFADGYVEVSQTTVVGRAQEGQA